MERLTQRADFLAAARGVKVPGEAFVLQARDRRDGGPARFGFTVSKKVGSAVERNRVRRRLRDVVRRSADAADAAAAAAADAGHDYVLIGRRAALHIPFERMLADFAGALARVDRRGAQKSTA